jgi:O-antigen/teichoic acid export membrane protein
MLYAFDRADAPLKARLIGTIIFFLIIAPLAWTFGVIGAAMAFVAGTATMVLILVMQLWQEFRRVRA